MGCPRGWQFWRGHSGALREESNFNATDLHGSTRIEANFTASAESAEKKLAGSCG